MIVLVVGNPESHLYESMPVIRAYRKVMRQGIRSQVCVTVEPSRYNGMIEYDGMRHGSASLAVGALRSVTVWSHLSEVTPLVVVPVIKVQDLPWAHTLDDKVIKMIYAAALREDRAIYNFLPIQLFQVADQAQILSLKNFSASIVNKPYVYDLFVASILVTCKRLQHLKMNCPTKKYSENGAGDFVAVPAWMLNSVQDYDVVMPSGVFHIPDDMGDRYNFMPAEAEESNLRFEKGAVKVNLANARNLRYVLDQISPKKDGSNPVHSADVHKRHYPQRRRSGGKKLVAV